MVDFAGLKTIVSAEISRGTALDASIGDRVNWAIRWLERNYNMQYMHRYVTFTLAANSRSVSFPSGGTPKRIEFIRQVKSDNTIIEYPKVDPQDVTELTVDPTGWWLDGTEFLWFDRATSGALALELEMLYWQFSADLVADADAHWLLDNAEDLMVAQTMLFMARLAKQDAWIASYKNMRDEGLQTLISAEAELDAGARDPSMIYQGATGS